jgi:hypothetical protein
LPRPALLVRPPRETVLERLMIRPGEAAKLASQDADQREAYAQHGS